MNFRFNHQLKSSTSQPFLYNQNTDSRTNKSRSEWLDHNESQKNLPINYKSTAISSYKPDNSNYSTNYSKELAQFQINSVQLNSNSFNKPKTLNQFSPKKYNLANQSQVANQYQNLDSLTKFGTQNQTFYEKNDNFKKDNFDNKNQTLSWTKCIGMELKIQELQKKIAEQQKSLLLKSTEISQLEKRLRQQQHKYQNIKGDIQAKYQKYIEEQKKQYDLQLEKKRVKILQLTDKVMEEAKSSLSQEMKLYMHDLINKNLELQLKIQNRITDEQFKQKMNTKHQQDDKQKDIKINQQAQMIKKLEIQLKQVVNRFLVRFNSTHDSSSCLQIIKSQQLQINQLRNSYQTLQTSYLKAKSTQNELTNKLKTCQVQHNRVAKLQKAQYLRQITNLGIIISQKQSQIITLKRKLSMIQNKYKTKTQELRTKDQLIQRIAKNRVKTEETQQENPSLHEANQLVSKYEQQIKRLKKRIVLLQN